MEDQINTSLDNYNTVERVDLQMLIDELPYSSYIRIPSAAGLTPTQILDISLSHIPEKELIRPLAISLESEGDFKALLTQGLEENAIPRRFSPWRRVDPVPLFHGKIEYGTPEQATSYGGYQNIHKSSSVRRSEIYSTSLSNNSQSES